MSGFDYREHLQGSRSHQVTKALREHLPHGVQNYIAALERENKKLKGDRRKLAETAVLDQLTGVYNRRGFDWRFRKAEQAAQHKGQSNNFLLLFDLDGFKGVNDTYGHPVGDTVLKETAAYIQQGLRDSDLVARLGGDEFAAILYRVGPGTHETEIDQRTLGELQLLNATQVAEHLLHSYTGEVVPSVISKEDVDAFPLSLSAGLTRITDEPLDEILATADAALLEAKALGKNRVMVYGR